MAEARTRVVVDGRVQGVWFRQSTLRAATQAGVTGWVRNLPGGEVEAVFEGPAEKVASAVEWCRRGPEHAFVASVQSSPRSPRALSGFEIR